MTQATPAPAPLTPADCNLQDFAFMPVDVQRLLKSDTWVMATDAEKVAAVCLWFESWHQVPAASLPNKERMLGHLAQCRTWAKVKEQAMRGWILCSDGRYYHPVVAEKALEAWIEKLLSTVTGATGNAKRWGISIDVARTMGQLQEAIGMLHALAPRSKTLRKKAVAAVTAGIVPGSPPEAHQPPPGASAPDQKTSGADSGADRNRQGQGQGQGSINTSEASPLHPTSAAPPSGRLNGHGAKPPEQPEPGPEVHLPPCPHQQLIALYAKHLGHLRQPREWDGPRAEAMRTRWRECAKPSEFSRGYATLEAGLAFWDRFFGYVATTELAQGFPRDGGKRWLPDLPWLVKRENFLKVIEGNYAE